MLDLHGFGSSALGEKVRLLRERLEPSVFEFVTPDLNVPSFRRLDFDAMAERTLRTARRSPPDVVVGSSLGALVALEAARRGLDAPLLLIAPALAFGSRWRTILPPGDPLLAHHHRARRRLPIHRRFFLSMVRTTPEREPPAQRVVIVMGRNDETVPFAGVAGVWRRWKASGRLAPGSRFLAIRGGDHSLTAHVDTLAATLRSLA